MGDMVVFFQDPRRNGRPVMAILNGVSCKALQEAQKLNDPLIAYEVTTATGETRTVLARDILMSRVAEPA